MLRKYFAQFETTKKRNIIIFIIMMVLTFIAAGFAFFEALRMICNILGAIVCKSPWQALDHLKRCGSSIILFFGVMYVAPYLYRLFMYDEKRQQSVQKKGAITLLSFGGAGIIYYIIGLATGLYQIYEGYPTLLYPIDMMLLSLLFIGLGIFFLVDHKVVKMFSLGGLVSDPERKVYQKVLRLVGFIFCYFVACFSIYGLVMSPFIFDFRTYPLWGILFILIFLEYLLTFSYKYMIIPIINKESCRKVSYNMSIVAFMIGFVLVVLNTISVLFYNNIACEVSNGLLVISFTASFNVEYYIYMVALLVPPLVLMNSYRPLTNQKKKELEKE